MKHRQHGVAFALTGSPQSLVTESNVFSVAKGVANPHTEPVSFQIRGTWNSATVTLHQCIDYTDSPLVFTSTGTAYTSDKAGTWTLPTDTLFKLVLTGHGSPVPNIIAEFKGDIDIHR